MRNIYNHIRVLNSIVYDTVHKQLYGMIYNGGQGCVSPLIYRHSYIAMSLHTRNSMQSYTNSELLISIIEKLNDEYECE
jgi:hypothetical protein